MCASVWRHRVKATDVTVGLAESNGSSGLTACTLGSAPGPMISNKYGKTIPFLPVQ